MFQHQLSANLYDPSLYGKKRAQVHRIRGWVDGVKDFINTEGNQGGGEMASFSPSTYFKLKSFLFSTNSIHLFSHSSRGKKKDLRARIWKLESEGIDGSELICCLFHYLCGGFSHLSARLSFFFFTVSFYGLSYRWTSFLKNPPRPPKGFLFSFSCFFVWLCLIKAM